MTFWHVFLEFPFIHIPIDPPKYTLSFSISILPVTFIVLAVSKTHRPSAVHFALFPMASIFIAILPSFHAMAISSAIGELAFVVAVTMQVCQTTFAVSLVLVPLALVGHAGLRLENTETLSLVILHVTRKSTDVRDLVACPAVFGGAG